MRRIRTQIRTNESVLQSNLLKLLIFYYLVHMLYWQNHYIRHTGIPSEASSETSLA